MTAADRMAAIAESANFATGMCGDDPLGQDVHWLIRRCKLLEAVRDALPNAIESEDWSELYTALDALTESEKGDGNDSGR